MFLFNNKDINKIEVFINSAFDCCLYIYENCLNKKARLYSYLQNDGPGFCSVHRRSLFWQRGKAKHGTGS
jgi:hypothetical protein